MKKCELALGPWRELAEKSACLQARNLGFITCNDYGVNLPAYTFVGPEGGSEPLRIGLFAGIHGDEPAGTDALGTFVRKLEQQPELAAGYRLFFYPMCNPSGFAAGTRMSCRGKDLNREFWSQSTEPEILLLELEIRTQRFQGLISLHSDDTSEGIYGFAKGALMTQALLEPALRAAELVLPRDPRSEIDGFAAKNGIICECYQGVLTAPPDLNPAPFEVIFETPQLACRKMQEEAFLCAIESILREYQKMIAFAANL